MFPASGSAAASASSTTPTYDPFSSSNSTPFAVGHSLWLYSIFPGLIFVSYSLLASLVLNLSDSSKCDSPVRAFLYLSIACGYIFVFFICYLFLFGRPKKRIGQNAFLTLFSMANLAVTLWGSNVLYDSGIVNSSFTTSYNSSQPQYALAFADFLASTPCTRTLAFRISLLGLAINYLYFLVLALTLLYSLCEHLCCRHRIATTEILGIGGIERTRARKLMELQLAREAGMAIAQEEFMKNMKTFKEEEKKPELNGNGNSKNIPAQDKPSEGRLFNRTGWNAQ